ncbi:YtrH family sporulation protein [Marinicrinis lubricantis]|uniref:YtrH family sporulation protein n=1 Tax=Marinicrinis lubricantis TaxID=2086470 RepID=A0ABW1IIT2_9BACL
MGLFITQMINYFLLAFGVVIGASLMSGIASVLTLQPPGYSMQEVAQRIKIWAIVASIGGTIDPFREMESHFLSSQYSPVIKQILYIVSAFMGAYCGTKLMEWLSGGGNTS